MSSAQISNGTGEITGKLKDGTSYQVQGPSPSLPNDVTEMRQKGVAVSFPPASTNLLSDLLPYIFIIGIGALFIYFIGRQTKGQMSGIMSIGRSKAKTFSSDRPSTTFEDVGRLRRRQTGDQRGRRLLEDARPVQGDRGEDPQGRAPGRAPWNGQDAPGPGRGGRGGRALHVGERIGLHGDVRRRRRQPGARPVPNGPQAGAGHRLRRRDRLHRPQAGGRARWWARRARADPQPDALGDGRLRHVRGRRDDRGDQPSRHPRPRTAASGSVRPSDRGAAARPGGATAHPAGPLQGKADVERRGSQPWWPAARRE